MASSTSTGGAALSEREKMTKGLGYDPNEVSLQRDRFRVRHLLHAYNNSLPPSIDFDESAGPDSTGPPERRELLAKILHITPERIQESGREIILEPPLRMDYGYNVRPQGSFYANFNTVFLDCGLITIGHNVMFGPNCQLLATGHSVEVAERTPPSADWEFGAPITIGKDCWLGAGVTIVGPANIGEGVTIAAGAVVRGNVESHVVVGGVPARVIKRLKPHPEYQAGQAASLAKATVTAAARQ